MWREALKDGSWPKEVKKGIMSDRSITEALETAKLKRYTREADTRRINDLFLKDTFQV